MIRGAIFDLDGTLLNSMWIWDAVGLKYLETLGIEGKPELREEVRRMSLTQAAEHINSTYKLNKPIQEVMDGINAQVQEGYESYLQLKPGAIELLDRLSEHGAKMIIASATDKHLIEAALRRLGIREYFLDILTCTDVGASKHEPKIFEEALRRLGAAKKDTYVFEDAFHAANTAKEAGFKVVGVYDASEARTAELEALADIYTSDFMNLETIYV